MTRVVLDADLKTRLLDLSEPLELCDGDGRVLARVLPVFTSTEDGPFEPQISEEELDRREQGSEWLTTAEVLAYLEKL